MRTEDEIQTARNELQRCIECATTSISVALDATRAVEILDRALQQGDYESDSLQNLTNT